MSVEHVVVVGGGVTGLTAAYRLSQAGVDVTLVEPGPLGGKVQTSVFAGRAVDEGADAFLLRVPWALALCHDLELDGELVSPAERNAQVFVDGTRRPIPAGHLMGVPTDLDALAASGLVSPAAVDRARQDLTAPGHPLAADDDVAVGAYLRDRLGDEVVDRLIDPLIGGINAGDTATMSLAAVVPQLDAAARSGDPSLIRSCQAQRARTTAHPDAPIFAAPLGGMARLVDGLLMLMPAVEIRQGRSVRAIDPDGTVHLDDGTALTADGVIVATPAFAAAPLLSAVAPDAAATLEAIDHSSVGFLTLAFREADLGDVTGASGCLVPRDQGTLVTAVSFATSKWAQLRDPERGDVILRASTGRTGDTRHLDLDDADLAAAVVADLDRILGVRGAPTEVRVTRYDRGFPQYAPGHLARIDALDAALAPTKVRMAGMALRGVGIPACIRSAEDAVASFGVTWPTRRGLTR